MCCSIASRCEGCRTLKFDLYTQARVIKLQKQIEFAAPGASVVPTHTRLFEVLLPNFLLSGALSMERLVRRAC